MNVEESAIRFCCTVMDDRTKEIATTRGIDRRAQTVGEVSGIAGAMLYLGLIDSATYDKFTIAALEEAKKAIKAEKAAKAEPKA